MIVKLDLDPKLVWRAEAIAEKRGMSLAQLVAVALVPPKSEQAPQTVAAQRTRLGVIELHSEGFTDAEIASRVGRVEGHVARVRRAAGLKANRRPHVGT